MSRDKEVEEFINRALFGSQEEPAKKRKAKKPRKVKIGARYRWDLKRGGLTKIG